MEHENSEWSEMILWDLLGELDREGSARLNEHLRECSACRDARAELEKLHALLARDGMEPSVEQLGRARRRLFGALPDRSAGSADVVAPFPVRGRLEHQWSGSRRGGHEWGIMLRAAAMLLVGVLCGFWLGQWRGAGAPPEADERISNVRLLDAPDAAGAPLEVVYESVRPVRVRGDLKDERVQRILLYAAVHDPNDGIRLTAVDQLTQLPPQPDARIVQTLITALKTDDNPGVRKRALEALGSLPWGPEIQEALLYALQFDPNPGLRVAAINTLEGAAIQGVSMGKGVADILRERSRYDDNNYVRQRSQGFLQEVEYR